MSTVLVVDDDRTVVRLVQKALEGSGVGIRMASDAEGGRIALEECKPDMLLLDVRLPDASGLELARQIRAVDPKLPVAFITVADDSDTAIEAMKLGAYEFLLKPLDVGRVRDVVGRALETRRLMQVPVKLGGAEAANGRSQAGNNAGGHDEDVLVGRSRQLVEVYKEVGRVAEQDVPVLICGESGTGKEWWPGRSTSTAAATTARFWRSTAPR